VTPDFALGSASADYGTSVENDQDEPIRAELPSSPKTSAIVVLSDYLGTPGASIAAGEFKKPTHLRMSPAAAQDHEAMLALLRVPATPPKYKGDDGRPVALGALTTSVVVPADADSILGEGGPLALDRATSLPARPTIVVRAGSGAIAVSVVDAGGLECVGPGAEIATRTAPTLRFEPLDRGGPDQGPTARIAIEHAPESLAERTPLDQCFARVAVLMLGQRCADDACARALLARTAGMSAAATRTFDPRSGAWDVRVAAGATDLHVHREVGSPNGPDTREVHGHEPPFHTLSVNGRAIVLGP
jgi:hypothetical protein